MIDPSTSPGLSGHLMEIAGNPAMREELSGLMGDYCHQCRNRLNSLKLSIYLARKQGNGLALSDWCSVETDYKALEDQVERLQAMCRPIAMAPVVIDFALLIDDRVSAWRETVEAHGREFVVDPPADRTEVRFDVDRVGSSLDVIVRWRSACLPSDDVDPGSVRVGWGREGSDFVFRWAESTCGEESPFDPEHVWSLPILTRVVAEHGGSVEVREQAGWTMTARWPARADKLDRQSHGQSTGRPADRP